MGKRVQRPFFCGFGRSSWAMLLLRWSAADGCAVDHRRQTAPAMRPPTGDGAGGGVPGSSRMFRSAGRPILTRRSAFIVRVHCVHGASVFPPFSIADAAFRVNRITISAAVRTLGFRSASSVVHRCRERREGYYRIRHTKKLLRRKTRRR